MNQELFWWQVDSPLEVKHKCTWSKRSPVDEMFNWPFFFASFQSHQRPRVPPFCSLVHTQHFEVAEMRCTCAGLHSCVLHLSKGIYNRLALIICLILDIDMALWSLTLPWEVKSNKSWTTIFAVRDWFNVYGIR